ncbi:MAG: chromate efflux transporter [Kofleriaceae bacterium]|nr:chromate efflux transporter [Kofleriaceae bacterium]
MSALREVAGLFLRLGTTAFGGPAAHIAMMEDEVVVRRKWVSREEFLDLVGATNLIPGPNSTELAIHLGYRRAGWPGLVIAGLCFIVPAALLVTAIAWAYVRYGALPEGLAALNGIKPVVIAIVAQALWRLGRSAVKSPLLAAVGAAAFAAVALGAHELAVLAAAGAVMAATRLHRAPTAAVMVPLVPASAAMLAAPFSLGGLFFVFLKIGSVLFGSGYVLFAFMRTELVERLHWLTEAQLVDAVAVGQLTPGPLFTSATFVGYLLADVSGAAVATAGIFLPAFVFVAASGPLVPWLRKHAAAGAFLDGLNVASLALMTLVTIELGRGALVDGTSVAIAGVSAVALALRVNTVWLVLAGAAAGVLVY